MAFPPRVGFAVPKAAIIGALLALFAVALPAQAQNPAPAQDPNLQAIRAILEKPDAEIDLARTKLTIDHMIDPSVDVEATLAKLDLMAKEIKLGLPPNASSQVKLNALRSFLYQAGPWNNNQPYSYDFNDPLGKNTQNKLISRYLATKKGNCVSMPFLFIVLGQKLGLDVTASTAPLHIFVKYRDETGQYHNLEATSGGGVKQDAGYQKDFDITPKAVTQGIYMWPLSKKETVALMLGTLIEHLGKQDEQERRIAWSDLVLEYYPLYVDAMLHKGSANYKLLNRYFVSKYPTPAEIPILDRPLYETLAFNNRLWFEQAIALGWKEPTGESEEKYAQTMKKNAQLTKR